MYPNRAISRAPSNPSSDSRPPSIVADRSAAGAPETLKPGAVCDIAMGAPGVQPGNTGPQGLTLETSRKAGNGGQPGSMNAPRTPDMMGSPVLSLLTTSTLGASGLMLGAPGTSSNPYPPSQQQAFLNPQNSGIPVAPAPNLAQPQHPVAKKTTTQMDGVEREMVRDFAIKLATKAAFISTLHPSVEKFFSKLTNVMRKLGHVKVREFVEEFGDFILTSLENETECRQLISLLNPLELLKEVPLLANGEPKTDLATGDKVPIRKFADKLLLMSEKLQSTFDYLLSSIAELLQYLDSVMVWEMVITYGDLCIKIAKKIQSGAAASSGSAPTQDQTPPAHQISSAQVHLDASEPAIGAPKRDANIKDEDFDLSVESGPSRDVLLAKIAELEAVVKAQNEEMAKMIQSGAAASSSSIIGASQDNVAPTENGTAAAQEMPLLQVQRDAHEPAMEVSPLDDNIGEYFDNEFDLPVESGPVHETLEAENAKLAAKEEAQKVEMERTKELRDALFVHFLELARKVQSQTVEMKKMKKDKEEELSRTKDAHRQGIDHLLAKHADELKRLEERTLREMSGVAVSLGLESERIKTMLDKELEQWFKNCLVCQDQATSASDSPDTPSTSSNTTRKIPENADANKKVVTSLKNEDSACETLNACPTRQDQTSSVPISSPSTFSPSTRKRPMKESIEKGTDEVKKPRNHQHHAPLSYLPFLHFLPPKCESESPNIRKSSPLTSSPPTSKPHPSEEPIESETDEPKTPRNSENEMSADDQSIDINQFIEEALKTLRQKFDFKGTSDFQTDFSAIYQLYSSLINFSDKI